MKWEYFCAMVVFICFCYTTWNTEHRLKTLESLAHQQGTERILATVRFEPEIVFTTNVYMGVKYNCYKAKNVETLPK